MYLESIEDIAEEGMSGTKPRDLRAFATNMIRYGELLLNTMLTFLNIVLTFNMETFMFLFNELINYNKKLSGIYG